MRTINHTRLEPYISSARLNTYSNFFAPADQIELFGCYLWSKEVAGAFFPLLQVLEITLRNAIHKEARNALGPYWFDNVATRPQRRLSASQHRHVQHLADSIRNARTEIRRDLNMPRTATVSEDRIIAKVTFGFWTNLFSAAFDVNRNPRALWPNLLRPVFPNAPQGHRDRATMQGKLLAIKTFRNKAFHHEPIWNIGRPAGVIDAINKLQSTCDDISDMIKWISLDGLDLVERAGYISTIRRVCSLEHLDYLKNPGANDKPFSRVKRELRAIICQPNHTTHITLNGRNKGKILGS
ncbi:Abi family protein [Aurantivibrio plasticivorans]